LFGLKDSQISLFYEKLLPTPIEKSIFEKANDILLLPIDYE
jgi:hypothetical protein